MEILLEPIKGGWRAVTPHLRNVQAEAETQEEAIQQIRSLWAQQMAQGAQIIEVEMPTSASESAATTERSVLPPKRRRPSEFAGSLKDNPLWPQWREAVEAYRAERDAEI